MSTDKVNPRGLIGPLTGLMMDGTSTITNSQYCNGMLNSSQLQAQCQAQQQAAMRQYFDNANRPQYAPEPPPNTSLLTDKRRRKLLVLL